MVLRQEWESLNMLQMLLEMWSLLNCLSRAGRSCSLPVRFTESGDLCGLAFTPIPFQSINMGSSLGSTYNQVTKGEEVGAVESVKAASEVESIQVEEVVSREYLTRCTAR